MRLADCRPRDLFWKPRRARAAGRPMQCCKPLLHGRGWLLRCRDCGFLEVNSGPKMPPTPWFWPHPQSQRTGGVPRRPRHMNPELGFVVIKIWLKREILTAALRPATWDSPRAPGNDPGERLGKGASVVTNRLAARGTPPGGRGQTRNSLCRWKPETPLPVLSADAQTPKWAKYLHDVG